MPARWTIRLLPYLAAASGSEAAYPRYSPCPCLADVGDSKTQCCAFARRCCNLRSPCNEGTRLLAKLLESGSASVALAAKAVVASYRYCPKSMRGAENQTEASAMIDRGKHGQAHMTNRLIGDGDGDSNPAVALRGIVRQAACTRPGIVGYRKIGRNEIFCIDCCETPMRSMTLHEHRQEHCCRTRIALPFGAWQHSFCSKNSL